MYTYLVSENKLITPSVRLITLVHSKPKNKPLLYQPGQYAAISLHDALRPTTTRCFSLTSSPTQGDFLQFSIREKGKFTSALGRLKMDDPVVVRGPFGSFVFNEHMHTNATFFAGGIGIAPFISMLRYATDVQSSTKINLVYSCRNEEDIPFLHELQKLEKQNKNLRVTYVIGDGRIDRLQGQAVIGGSLDDTVISQLGLNYQNEMYMLCGPPQYMKAVQTLLKKRGVHDDKILTEAFSQGPSPYNTRLMNWPFNVYALTGLFLLLSSGAIVAAEINKTLPKLTQNSTLPSHTTDVAQVQAGDLVDKINAVPPQVDTNISQEPIVTYIPNPIKNEPVTTPSTPVSVTPVVVPKPTPIVKPTPAPVVSPTPKPTPVVVPTKPPKSTVS